MDSLISREAVIEALEFERDCLETPERINGVEDAIEVIQQLPSVAAVPLDKLCEWLQINASYNSLTKRIFAEQWKEILIKWMEEQNA